MKLVLLRHEIAAPREPGAAVETDAKRPLTDEGRKRARRAARGLHRLLGGIDRLASSPLRRARETAEALASSLELPIVVWDELHELRESDGYGELGAEEQRLRRWSVWMAEHADDPDHSFRGGESFNDVLGRVRAVQDRLVAEGDRSVLAVSHGIFTRFFLMWSLLGDRFAPGQAQRLWQLGSHNCGLTSFEHLEPGASGYATDSWRCLTWMQRPWDPP